MPSVVIVEVAGTYGNGIVTVASLPPGFKLGDGETISWQHKFQFYLLRDEPGGYKGPQRSIIKHGAARIFLDARRVQNSVEVEVRIESPNTKDYVEAIEVAVRLMDGEVVTSKLDKTEHQDSFILGIWNDLVRLWNMIRPDKSLPVSI